MRSSRAQKETRFGGMHTAVIPRDKYAKSGSHAYGRPDFRDEWNKKEMPNMVKPRFAKGGDTAAFMDDDEPKKRKARGK